MCACACVCACVHSCFVYCVRSGACVVVEDVETRQQQHLLGHKTEITAVLLSRDGALIASASGRHKVCVCVFVRAFVALLCLLYLSQPNASLVRLLIIASITHTHTKSHERSEVRVWDAQTGACKHRLVYHLSAVAALAFSLDNRQLLSLGHYQDPSLVWRHDERKRVVGRRGGGGRGGGKGGGMVFHGCTCSQHCCLTQADCHTWRFQLQCLWDVSRGVLLCSTHIDVPVWAPECMCVSE